MKKLGIFCICILLIAFIFISCAEKKQQKTGEEYETHVKIIFDDESEKHYQPGLKFKTYDGGFVKVMREYSSYYEVIAIIPSDRIQEIVLVRSDGMEVGRIK